MTKIEKARVIQGRFEGPHWPLRYSPWSANCAAIGGREAAFAEAFLDARLDPGPPIRVFDSQIDGSQYRLALLDRFMRFMGRRLNTRFTAMPRQRPT
jgi:hypothetical protein